VAAILAPEGLAQAAASGQRPALSKIFRAVCSCKPKNIRTPFAVVNRRISEKSQLSTLEIEKQPRVSTLRTRISCQLDFDDGGKVTLETCENLKTSQSWLMSVSFFFIIKNYSD